MYLAQRMFLMDLSLSLSQIRNRDDCWVKTIIPFFNQIRNRDDSWVKTIIPFFNNIKHKGMQLRINEDHITVTISLTFFHSLFCSHFTKVYCLIELQLMFNFFSSGNHELWIRTEDSSKDSISKFHDILNMCDRIGISYHPELIPTSPSESVWVVPLFSWYSKPEDDLQDSLWIKPKSPDNVGFCESIWMDSHLCDWSKLSKHKTAAMYFSSLNQHTITRNFDDWPVISFSHFLPRSELIPTDDKNRDMVRIERELLGLGDTEPPKVQGSVQGFNFSRYAGSRMLETQIRQIRSAVHVYGHQHRNRDCVLDGVRYVSHCLGNPREQRTGWVWGLSKWKGPKRIWPGDE